jgi:carboxylesterase
MGTAGVDLSRVAQARSFYFKRGSTGCLLVHGITATPFTVRAMGEWLASRGITVYAPVLAGHARTWKHLEATRWTDWYESAEQGYALLRKRCRKVFAAGLSMGGAQVLHLAAHHPELDGVIAMSPAAYAEDWRLKFLPLLRLVQRTVPAIGGAINDEKAMQEICYNRLPLRSVAELLKFQSHLREELHLVRCPALVVQGRHDPIVPPGNARFVYGAIGSARKQLVYLPRSSHVITMDCERQRLFRLALRFLKRA